MQKWEYCEIEVTATTPIANASAILVTYHAGGQHKECVKKYGILLAKLGEEGWEMVGSNSHVMVNTLATVNKLNYVFKRPIIELNS